MIKSLSSSLHYYEWDVWSYLLFLITPREQLILFFFLRLSKLFGQIPWLEDNWWQCACRRIPAWNPEDWAKAHEEIYQIIYILLFLFCKSSQNIPHISFFLNSDSFVQTNSALSMTRYCRYSTKPTSLRVHTNTDMRSWVHTYMWAPHFSSPDHL